MSSQRKTGLLPEIENDLLELSVVEEESILDKINSAKESLKAGEEYNLERDDPEDSEVVLAETIEHLINHASFKTTWVTDHSYSIKEPALDFDEQEISDNDTLNSDQQQLTNEQQEELYQSNKDL
jgi:Ser-tRNA(Ala) deacylase AlaX